MVLETRIKPVVKDYGTLYEAELKFDDSPQRRARLVDVYNRELVERRLITLGGTLTFVLICLGAFPAISAPTKRPRVITPTG